jgi:hypothetical protein
MNSDTTIPRDLIECVHCDLKAGEQVVWMAQPTPHYVCRETTTHISGGISLLAFSLFWAWAVNSFQQALDMSEDYQSFYVTPLLVSLPFALIGIGLIASPWLHYRRTLRTVYAITNRRVIICNPDLLCSDPIRSYMPDELQHVCRKKKKAGSGDVFLRYESYEYSNDGLREVRFDNIRDPETVTQMLIKLAEQSAAPLPRAPQPGHSEGAH